MSVTDGERQVMGPLTVTPTTGAAVLLLTVVVVVLVQPLAPVTVTEYVPAALAVAELPDEVTRPAPAKT